MCGVWSVARVCGEGVWRGRVARACGEGHLRGEGDRHNGVVHVQVILLVHEDVVGRVVQRRQLGQAPHSTRVNRSGVGLSVGGGGAGCGGRGACVGDGGRLSLGRGEQPLLQLPAPVPVPQRQERGGGGADQDGQGRRPLAHEAHRAQQRERRRTSTHLPTQRLVSSLGFPLPRIPPSRQRGLAAHFTLASWLHSSLPLGR